MSSTLFRLGLWMLVVILAVFVMRETYNESALAELVEDTLLQQAMMLAVLIVAAGVVLKIFEKGKNAVVKNRCRTCGRPVPSGAIYCREHLRSVLDLEDRKTHNTRIR